MYSLEIVVHMHARELSYRSPNSLILQSSQ